MGLPPECAFWRGGKSMRGEDVGLGAWEGEGSEGELKGRFEACSGLI